MRLDVHDRGALLAVLPTALSAYARSAGWSRLEPYRTHSDVYTGESRPDIIVPRTERLGDYATVVATLISTFAEVADQDESSVYRSLVTADRDVVSVRVAEGNDGSIALEDGVDLVGGTRDLFLAVACSLRRPQAVYRAGANREATELVRQMRLGQTEQGSFLVTLLTPVVPPPIQKVQQRLFTDLEGREAPLEDQEAPVERRMTQRLVEAVTSARYATERAAAGDDGNFAETVNSGVSANLCEALVRIIKPFSILDISVSWARTRPMDRPGTVVRFGRGDVAVLREAARSFRERAPRPGVSFHGFVRRLNRPDAEADGTISFVTNLDGQAQSIIAVLERADYERAIEAHKDHAMVSLVGDLERMGQRWRLLNPSVVGVLRNDESEMQES